LIDAQNGVLDLSSEPGVGTCFHIELKFEKAAATALQTTILPEQEKANPPTVGKVLVVDDDPLILKLCSLILTNSQVEHVTFNDPFSSLEYATNSPVTHVFMDIRMPGMNGVELCGLLRKKYSGVTRFIALTAHVLPEERQNLLREGFDAILTKPFHENELLHVLGLLPAKEAHEAEEVPDFTLLRKMTMGDEALFHSIISQFVEETQEDVSQMKIKLKEQNSKALRETVHKMAGRLAQLGMISLGGKLHMLEKQLVAGHKVVDLSSDINGLIREVDEITAQIRQTA
jgi:CheY-like chemotaxis protein